MTMFAEFKFNRNDVVCYDDKPERTFRVLSAYMLHNERWYNLEEQSTLSVHSRREDRLVLVQSAAQPTISRLTIYSICNAYESGLGRGISGRDMSQPYTPESPQGIAYHEGWIIGRDRRLRKPESIENELNTAAQAAYLELLISMPNERRITLKGQTLLCQLRDAIARCTGNEPQDIQNIFEERASRVPRRHSQVYLNARGDE